MIKITKKKIQNIYFILLLFWLLDYFIVLIINYFKCLNPLSDHAVGLVEDMMEFLTLSGDNFVKCYYRGSW